MNKTELNDVSFDHIADRYDETRIIPMDILSRFYIKTIAERIQVNPNSLVLDAGVGTGRTVGPLLDLDVQLVGVDISRKMLRKMIEKLKENRESSRVSLVLSDVTRLPFRAQSFDAVISVHVLHLVKKWKSAIQEAKRVLKAEGLFVAATHGAPDLASKVGQKYFELCSKNNIPQARGLRRNLTRILNKVLKQKKMSSLERVSEIVLERNSFLGRGGKIYLEKQARTHTMERYVIKWKEVINVDEIFNRLSQRIISKQWRIPAKIHEKVMFELGKWKTEETRKKGPFETLTREFEIVAFRFK